MAIKSQYKFLDLEDDLEIILLKKSENFQINLKKSDLFSKL